MRPRHAIAPLLAALCLSAAHAAPVHVQGRALDADGAPHQGSAAVTARLYAAATGGTAWHEELLTGVSFDDGYFSVSLDVDDSNALSAPTWFAVAIDGTELAPRQPVGAVPNALVAGRVWLGDSADRPGTSCRHILESGASTGSKLYWIDPDGGSTSNAHQAWCDMATDGGGWTLVHTKSTYTFVPWAGTHNPACGASTGADCASAVHPNLQWDTAMWRFRDTEGPRVFYRRSSNGAFSDFLRGGAQNTNPTVCCFSRFHPVDGHSAETSVASLHFYTASYISESHSGTDQWLDLWTGVDSTNAYTSVSGTNTRGTKCIAGYCRDEPLWLMVR